MVGSLVRLALGALVVAGPCGLAAQQPPAADTSRAPLLRVVIRVLDLQTEAPVPGAAVAIPQLRRTGLADGDGRVVLDSVPMGSWDVFSSAVGFMEYLEPMSIGVGDALVVRLEPRAIEIEGVEVTSFRRYRSERLNRRRNSQDGVRVMRNRLLQRSEFSQALGLVEGRYGFLVLDMQSRCPVAMYRGKQQVILFFIDEELVTPEDFRAKAPSEFAMVENFSDRQIRAYTPLFLEQFDARRLTPDVDVEEQHWACFDPGKEPGSPAGDGGRFLAPMSSAMPVQTLLELRWVLGWEERRRSRRLVVD